MSAFSDWPSVLPQADAPLAIGDDPDFRWTTPSLVRACYCRLDDVLPALDAREQPDAPLAVHVDVMRIESALSFRLSSLTLHARRVEIGAAASLAMRSASEPARACRLSIHADEWAFEGAVDALPLVVGGVGHRLRPQPPGGGVEALVEADGSVAIAETAEVTRADPLSGQIALNTARRLVYCPALDSPGETAWTNELPRKMADWVARTSDDEMLRADARAFAARLRTPRGGLHFVPALRLNEYGTLAKETQVALEAVENEYREHFNRERGLADQKKSATRMLGHYRNAKAFADKLLAQAAEEMAAASDATALAQRRLDERRSEIDASQAAFDAGIEARRAELEREAVWAVITGVFELGAGIAAVVATGGAAAPVAAAGAAQAAKSGAEAASKIKKLVELIKKIKKVIDAIAKVAAFYAKLKAAFDAIGKPDQARKRVAEAGSALPDPLDPEDQMNAADWDEFMVGLDTLFKPALAQGIAGADDYLLAMKKMAVRGKDLVGTHAELERAQHQFQQCLWQTLRDEADIADMQVRIDALSAERGAGSVLMTYYAQVRDRLKFRLIHAIENMADAYRFETLREPDARPGIMQSGAELARTLNELQQALVSAKEARAAQSTWNDYRAEVDGNVLARLKATGSMSWVVGLENFTDCDRVRVAEVLVWMRGNLGPQRRVIDISTSGHYVDRLRGHEYEFSARPLQRCFSYEPDAHGKDTDRWGDPVWVALRANDVEGDLFQPTAFTTWTISVSKKGADGPDLQQLTELVLEFKGTATRAAPRMLGAATRGGAPQQKAAKLLTDVVTL